MTTNRYVGAYARDGKCHNSQRGTYNHECGKLASWIGTKADGFQMGFCDDCKERGDERVQFVSFAPLPRVHALHYAFQHADDEWHAQLVKQFGSRASTLRYTREGKGEPGSYLRYLSDRFDQARDAYHAGVRATA